jgi:hypothetical protein
MGGSCRKHGVMENMEERDQMEDLYVGGKIILKLSLRKYGGKF